VPAIALGLATACTLDETGIGSTSDGDSDTDTDTGTGTDSDTGTGTESDTRTGTGSETDAPDRDLDGLPDENDPCVSAPNVLLSDGFAGWEGLTGEWDFAVDGATGTQAGGIGYAWDGGCPGAACLPDYFVDVVARIDAGAPVFGVLGSLQWPATEDHYCEVLPGDPWRMVLTGEPGAPDSDATDLVPAPGGAFAMRLIVRGDEQACRGHRVTDAVVRTTNPDRPAGGVGVYVFDGTMTFESVRVRSIPAACSPVAVNPPAP
jgi:hypothetical protein